MAATSSFRPANKGERRGDIVTIRLVPLAWTPRGVAVGGALQDVGIPLSGIFDWIDRTFPPEDEGTFIASVRDLEILARTQWETGFPSVIDDRSVLNIEDIPEAIAEGLSQPPSDLVACSVCRRLCVRDEFVWKEKQLCAWDHHAAAFGKRGPWHEGPYEERHFETIPLCAYVATPLLEEIGVEEVLALAPVTPDVALTIVNAFITSQPARPHMAVKTDLGFSLLREA
ncbi:MAG TPA: hypothetical protein VHX17_10505 [Candidatus Cybelea sp.]|jgi:hypothetical protein|nr:hypothetical protein [Candidatus Cybelea sp.]